MTTHLIAALDEKALATSRVQVPWIAIDGDDEHGYLVRGLEGLDGPVNFDYWFATLDEAMSSGDDFGIDRAAWMPREVRPGDFPDR